MRLGRITILAGTLTMQFLSDAQAEESLKLTIRVYNYARMEDRILREALQQAARIVGQVGANTEWIGCAVAPEDVGKEPACAEPLAARELLLKLLPHAMARKLKRTADTFGFAVPTTTAGLGAAFVFVKPAEQLAFYGPFPVGYDAARAVVVGHLIAHEIGHLLLGPDSHSSTGIMSFPWSEPVLKRLATAHLSFTQREAVLIRERLAARTHTPPFCVAMGPRLD